MQIAVGDGKISVPKVVGMNARRRRGRAARQEPHRRQDGAARRPTPRARSRARSRPRTRSSRRARRSTSSSPTRTARARARTRRPTAARPPAARPAAPVAAAAAARRTSSSRRSRAPRSTTSPRSSPRTSSSRRPSGSSTTRRPARCSRPSRPAARRPRPATRSRCSSPPASRSSRSTTTRTSSSSTARPARSSTRSPRARRARRTRRSARTATRVAYVGRRPRVPQEHGEAGRAGDPADAGRATSTRDLGVGADRRREPDRDGAREGRRHATCASARSPATGMTPRCIAEPKFLVGRVDPLGARRQDDHRLRRDAARRVRHVPLALEEGVLARPEGLGQGQLVDRHVQDQRGRARRGVLARRHAAGAGVQPGRRPVPALPRQEGRLPAHEREADRRCARARSRGAATARSSWSCRPTRAARRTSASLVAAAGQEPEGPDRRSASTATTRSSSR